MLEAYKIIRACLGVEPTYLCIYTPNTLPNEMTGYQVTSIILIPIPSKHPWVKPIAITHRIIAYCHNSSERLAQL